WGCTSPGGCSWLRAGASTRPTRKGEAPGSRFGCLFSRWTMASKLLLVDDDRTLLGFLAEFLQGEEYTVLTGASGAEALRVVYRERPDLVVLDVMMPGMDGWELVARLRELADFPIILLSAKSSEADKLRGFRMGVDDYVTKPFSFAELAA